MDIDRFYTKVSEWEEKIRPHYKGPDQGLREFIETGWHEAPYDYPKYPKTFDSVWNELKYSTLRQGARGFDFDDRAYDKYTEQYIDEENYDSAAWHVAINRLEREWEKINYEQVCRDLA